MDGASTIGGESGPCTSQIQRVSAASATIRALLRQSVPFVVTGMLDGWAASRWQLESIAQTFGSQETCVRLHAKSATTNGALPYEGECVYIKVLLGDFCRWLSGAQLPVESPLARFARANFVGYADYQDMPALFAGAPTGLAAVDWSPVLAACERQSEAMPRDGSRSTLWLGSEDSSTPLVRIALEGASPQTRHHLR